MYKALMMHEIDISVMRDKIYEVLDLVKIVHDMESGENDPIIAEKRELMKNIENIKETKLSLTTMSQCMDEGNMKLTLIMGKLQ